MLTLATIPAIAILVIVIVVLRTRHLHQTHLDQLRAETAARRRAALDDDNTNDRQLVTAIASQSGAIGELLQKYRRDRAEIAPSANATEAAAWTVPDLDRWLNRNAADRAVQIGRRLLYRALLTSVVVMGIAAGAAALRYHQISAAAAPATGIAEENSLAALPVDPFQLPVPELQDADSQASSEPRNEL